MQPFLTANEAADLISSTYSGQAFRAISFLATSTSARCQNDRFRLLWSEFNAIYKPLGNPGAEYLKVNECLKTLEKQGLINRARETFQEADLCLDDEFWCWDSFLKSFAPLKLKKSKTGHCSIHENAKRVLSDANGEILNAPSSQKKYEQWLKLLEAGNAIKDRIDGLPRDKGDSFIFIMSYFMYWRRCQTMHGESMSEVFKDEASNRFQKTLNDSLQELLIPGIKHCATC